MILAFIFGGLCGIALGLTGGGGSILAVPMLVYGIGLPFHQAVIISLMVVGLIALSGVVSRFNSSEVNILVAFIMAVGGILGAPLGSYINVMLPDAWLMGLFSCLMIGVGIWTLLKKSNQAIRHTTGKGCRYTDNGRLILQTRCQITIIIAGIVTGFLTGLFGVGGGFLIVPALLIVAKMPIKTAITTSLFVIFLMSTLAFASHLLTGVMINWLIAIGFILGGIIGMAGTLQVKDRLNGATIQQLFAILILLLGGIFLAITLFSSMP